MKKLFCFLLLVVTNGARAQDFGPRFHEIVKSATPAQLYAFLFALPKGGDLHHHNVLSAYANVWYDVATSPRSRQRNTYYSLVKRGNCTPADEAQPLYTNLQRASYERLSDCQKLQFAPLTDLLPAQKAAWLSSLILDQPGEGRDEFFERLVKRFADLSKDPELLADVMVENMRLFGAEGVRYIEAQMVPNVFQKRNGEPMDPEEADRIIAARLRQPDALATGVQLRLQDVIIRYLPNAEQNLINAYAWVASHRDRWVGINMAGREDNDKGYALRFLPTFRQMRRTYSDIPLSIHGGEKDNPGHEVRDTLLLGATRIGHGINLISDPDTMLLMRNNRYLVEINLVSNKVLEYIPDTAQHPFPEYLRTGIPVCLNTDDRGSWDSNMTDEYYTAVTTFHLTWTEVVELGRNSLTYSFAEPALKEKMLRDYDAALAQFTARYSQPDWQAQLAQVKPLVSGYARRTWKGVAQ